MALQYKPTAVNDNGSNRWNQLANNASRDAQYGGTAAQQAIQRDLERQRELEALEAKKRQEEAEDREARLAAARERANAAATNSGRANAQQSYATASGRTGTTPAPISYNAERWTETPEEERTPAAPYVYQPPAATAPTPEEERDASFFNLRPTPYVDLPTPTPDEQATPTAADTTETTTAARRSGEYRAEAQAPIVYTGGQVTGINETTGQTAAGTKDALAEAGDEEAEWMRQALQAAAAAGLNGTAAEEFANRLVGLRRITNQTQARRTGEERAEAQAPTGSRPASGAQTTPAITWGGAAQPAANGTAPEPQVWKPAAKMTTQPTPVTPQRTAAPETPMTNPNGSVARDPRYQAAVAALNRQGIYGEEADRQARQLVAAVNGVTEGVQNWFNPEQSMLDRASAAGLTFSGAAQPAANGVIGSQPGNSRPGAANAVDEIVGSGSGYDARTQAILDRAAAAGLTWGGAAQPAATFSGQQSAAGSQQTDPRANMQQTYTTESGKTNTTPAASQAGSQSNNQNGKTANTKGATYFNPSYGQGGKGVKLPYKKDGYTEKELMEYGNKSRGTYYGEEAYEGYYLAPNGKYYPIDQEKAAYYKANGGSYKGWEEPMRDYYNTFGTFYGYRPDWKAAGGLNTWKNNSSGSYSYSGGRSSGGSSSGGRSYGRGSTANNGIYYNGLTSWNA